MRHGNRLHRVFAGCMTFTFEVALGGIKTFYVPGLKNRTSKWASGHRRFRQFYIALEPKYYVFTPCVLCQPYKVAAEAQLCGEIA